MDVFETFRLRDAQPIEQREDNDRREPLRRRRRVVESAGPRRNTERLIDGRPKAFQIASRHRAADAVEIGGNLAPDVATVEIVQPRARKMLKRCGKRGLLEHRTDIGHFVLEEERFLESGCLGHFGQLFCREFAPGSG